MKTDETPHPTEDSQNATHTISPTNRTKNIPHNAHNGKSKRYFYKASISGRFWRAKRGRAHLSGNTSNGRVDSRLSTLKIDRFQRFKNNNKLESLAVILVYNSNGCNVCVTSENGVETSERSTAAAAFGRRLTRTGGRVPYGKRTCAF